MMEDILASLSEMGAFSKRQKKVAEYISANFDAAAFMTAEHLAKAANVSESTVVRFAGELGFDSFSGLRRALQDVLRSRIETQERRMEAENASPLHRAVIRTAESVRAADDTASSLAFEKMCLYIRSADRVCICGQGKGYALAQYAAASLCELRSGVSVLHAFDAGEAVRRLEKGDILVDISLRESSSDHTAAAAETGACVAHIAVGDHALNVRADDIQIRLSSPATVVMLIDALCAELASDTL